MCWTSSLTDVFGSSSTTLSVELLSRTNDVTPEKKLARADDVLVVWSAENTGACTGSRNR